MKKMNKKMWQLYRVMDGDHYVDVAIVRAASKDDALSKADLLDGEIDAELMVEVPWMGVSEDYSRMSWGKEWIREGVSRTWPVAYRSPIGAVTLFAADGMRYFVDDLRAGDGFVAGAEGVIVVLVPVSEYRRVLDYLGNHPMDVEVMNRVA